jgi:ribosome-binding factor A
VRRRTATYPRTLRVNQVLRQVLAEELERLADADELPMVTVTSVDVAPDMRTATVYVATLEEATAVVLEERRVHLQRTLGAQMTMKRTPRLTFKADPAIAAGSRVEELLRGLQDSQRAEAGADAEAEAGEAPAGGAGDPHEGESPAEKS